MTVQATLFPAFTVHCFACPRAVVEATPTDAHDAMEHHYANNHAALIARLTGGRR